MTKLEITNPDGIATTIDIKMEEFFSLAQAFVAGTKIEIPPMYFNKNGATITIK